MSKINKIQQDDINFVDFPPPLTPNQLNLELGNMYYNCTECSSLIEIVSLNNDIIEFICLNKQNNHGKKRMALSEYYKKMIKYNNEKVNNDKCDIHNKDNINNKYISYCFDCNLHLCKECLKTRDHINHKKSHIIEIQPIQEKLDRINEEIKDYKSRRDI